VVVARVGRSYRVPECPTSAVGVLNNERENTTMLLATLMMPALAAIGYSIIYMLLGGGLFGAVLIFFIAKALKK
jgi:hypothetical protein